MHKLPIVYEIESINKVLNLSTRIQVKPRRNTSIPIDEFNTRRC